MCRDCYNFRDSIVGKLWSRYNKYILFSKDG